MKRFRVTVNGTSYDVEVEELDGQAAPDHAAGKSETSSAPTPAPTPAPDRSPDGTGAGRRQSSNPETKPLQSSQPPTSIRAAGAGVQVKAPMPGTILKVQAHAGDSLKAGDVIMVLEAMKMENEITAPRAGIVDEIPVGPGGSVNAGDVLAVLS